ncbi:MAG TPA: hypothetical protein EYP17_10305 [Candidatus Latescibacteria bacterium]|nr:hypothetical protein [Candidatus Latescibacterota bacterium]
MSKVYFDVRDIAKALRLGFSGKKMALGFVGVVLGYVGYAILAYLALLAGGYPFGEIWGSYKFYPCVAGLSLPWYSWVIYGVGVVFWVLVLLATAAGIVKIAYRQLKGDEFYSLGDAKKFLRNNWKAAVLSPCVILAVLAFLVITGIIIGLLGRIPYVGELGFSIGLPVVFGGSLFAVFTAVVFAFSLLLSPAVVGTAEEDTLETIVQSFSTVWSQPWRLVLYEVLLGVYVVLATALFGAFAMVALWLMNQACGLLMGQKMGELTAVALGYLPSGLWSAIGAKLGGLPLQVGAGAKGTVLVSGVIGGIWLALILGFVLSYGWTSWAVGQGIIYLILRYKKDQENLLERKEREEEEAKEELKEEAEEKPEEEETRENRPEG